MDPQGHNRIATPANPAGQVPEPWAGSPYPGLRTLDLAQAPIFFGRSRETRDLLRRLADPAAPRCLVVTGELGSGKSSLVRAGVCGKLAAGGIPGLPGTEHWAYSSATLDGADPWADLMAALTASLPGRFHPAAARLPEEPGRLPDLVRAVVAERPGEAVWLLVLERLERLVSPAHDARGRDLLDLLLATAQDAPLRLLATLRSDALECALAHPGLRELVNGGGLYALGPPGHQALVRMIEGPAAAAGLSLDPALVERLAEDAAGEPGGLAPLAFTLRDLWGRRGEAGQIRLDHYLAVGGLHDLCARRAEQALERAGTAGRAALPHLLARLLAVGPELTVIRAAPAADLTATPGAAALCEALADPACGLLVQGPRGLTLAHEALLRDWPELHRWSEQCREARTLCRRIADEARTWAAAGQPQSLRWDHEALAPARALLAQADLLEAQEQIPEIGDFLTPEADWLDAELRCAATDPGRREDIGLRLARIGDPRPGLGLRDALPDLLWCQVPGGEVRLDGHGLVQVEPFALSAYPVTQAQFRAFIEAADGFACPDWWQDLDRRDPISGRLRRLDNYPATHVSWYDATAFCRWLSARLGQALRLPNEWEWQWAAQGAEPGFVYPWGAQWQDGVANTDEASLGRVAAVGLFPAGCSAQGVYDLAGNIWEWCGNEYERPQRRGCASDAARVLRGGSWRVNRGFARADFRLDGLPDDRVGGSGFRVLCAGTATGSTPGRQARTGG